MSKSAILVKFSRFKETLCEENSINIDSVCLNEELYQLIKNRYLKTIKIIDSNHTDSFTQEEIEINDCGKCILELIDKKILSISKIKTLNDYKKTLLNDLTVILNFRKIYLLKAEEYENDDNVILIIG